MTTSELLVPPPTPPQVLQRKPQPTPLTVGQQQPVTLHHHLEQRPRPPPPPPPPPQAYANLDQEMGFLHERSQHQQFGIQRQEYDSTVQQQKQAQHVPNLLHNGSFPRPMQQLQASSTLPYRAQVVAMGLCYRRLAFIWAIPPLACVLVPWILQATLQGCNFVSNGYGVSLLILTLVLTQAWYRLVERMAPDEEKLTMAYEKSAGVLPFIMFVISSVLIRAVIAPVVDRFPVIAQSFQWISKISLGTGMLLPLGTALLGIAVLMKFVGPCSIVRCSTVPTVCNPFVRPFRDVTSLLSYIASPNDHPGEMVWAPEFRNQQQVGRRFQFPTLRSFLGIICLDVLIAGVLSEYIVIKIWSNDPYHHLSCYALSTPTERSMVCLTCFLTIAFDLLRTGGLIGSGHEIDPVQYLSFAPTPSGSPRPKVPAVRLWSMIAFIITTTILVPLLSAGLMFLVMDSTTRDGGGLEQSWRLFGFCFATSAITISFLTLLDEAMRVSLCTPGCRLECIIREMKQCIRRDSKVIVEDEEVELVDVIVRSLAHGDYAVYSQILRENVAICDMRNSDEGVVEAQRNETASDDLAKVLLGIGISNCIAEAFFEEDIFRYIILESVGGKAVDKNAHPFDPDCRHTENIQRWITPRQPQVVLHSEITRHGGAEQICVLLVRALCAYIGGLGKALTTIANKPMPRNLTWTLPPGALVAAEYAMLGVARCIDEHLKMSSIAAADWRSTHLSMLVPTALNSAYALQSGVVDYFMLLSGGAKLKFGHPMHATPAMAREHMADHPKVMRVIEACEYLPTVVLTDCNRIKSIESTLSSGAFHWAQKLTTQASPDRSNSVSKALRQLR